MLSPSYILSASLPLLQLATAKPVTFISAEPTYTVCNESLLTWADGEPPYAVKAKIGPDDDRKFRTLQQHLNTTSYRFYCDLPAGTDLELWIQDSSGEQEAIPGDASIRQFVRANPGHTCPLYLFPGQTTNATVSEKTVTQTVLSTVLPSSSAGSDAAAQVTEEKSTSNTGQIAGGVVGGVLGAAIVAGLLVWIGRLKKQAKNRPYSEIEYEDQTTTRQAGASQPTIATAGLSGTGAAAGVVAGSSGSSAGGSASASQHPTLVHAHAGSGTPGAPDPSPEIKVMQLDAMLSPNSPQRTPSDSPSPGYFPHPPGSGTPGTPQNNNGLAGLVGLAPPRHYAENESEYEVDAGPAFAPQPPPRTVHPPQYRDVGKI